MIERLGNIAFEVSLLDRAGNKLPEILHQGVTYVVCTAGEDFEVQVSRKSNQWKAGEKYGAELNIDGKSCGYSHYLSEPHPAYSFNGWWIDHTSKKAFVFSRPPAAEGEAGPGAGSGSQAEGKKFFLQPSLGAKGGAAITQSPYLKRRVHNRNIHGGYKHRMNLRFETAPILQLRKILDPSNPSHARLIPTIGDSQQIVGGGQAAPKKKRVGGAFESPPSRKVKQEKKVVKKERSRSPKETVIETVDLTEDAHDDQDCMMYTVAKKAKVEGPKLEID